MKKKRKKLLETIISVTLGVIVLSCVLFLSSTSALFVNREQSKIKNNYNTGILSVTAISKSDIISLDNSLPISDEEGIETTPYIFTIRNNGNVNYEFDIQLLSTSENTIDPQYIKLKVDDDDVTTLSSLVDSKIKSGLVLEAQESMDITLRVWLSSETSNSQIGKSFNSELVINGIAISTTSNYGASAASYIVNKYNNGVKSTVVNNGITYNYCQSESLMNDRLGGVAKDLNAGNIRYYGSNPNNYIYFNCSDYDNQDESSCERWRIIGVFDNIVKIIRNDSIGDFSWDISNSSINDGKGVNEWSEAYLMKFLNDNYVNEDVNNGLKNDETKNKIASVSWFLGGISDIGKYADELYESERGVTHVMSVSDNVVRKDSWIGNIALLYPSDYGYATDFNECDTTLNSFDLNDDVYSCISNNWLFDGNDIWTLSPQVSHEYSQMIIGSNGNIASSITSSLSSVRPTLFLNSEEVIKSGNGSFELPYQLR